ncbi:Na-translocating system protein MpsC family protein [Neobacillus cucumis]|uniref:Na-translocating system protein MpsC family protein n=1 Tax=Neobacillus cucumis TaxID=1740721 RepID=UPI00285351E0|nr:Na-translocating system protein MpsC family protein [Neobacillus cucumis]MDR4945701.1 Na-translocating system protein MpsC family protein [Neobacillus cucumis]
MVATQEDLLSLSSSVSKIIKQGFGRGPETCYTVLRANRLYVYIRNFMTPAEEILTDRKEYNLMMKFRKSVIEAMSEEIVEEASELLNISFESLYQDWNYDSNSGILLLVNHSFNPDVKIDESFERKLFRLCRIVGSKLHKTPDELRIVKYTQNICAIESKGVMLPLDYLLSEQGNIDLLFTHAREIKKGYFQHRELFEDMFNRTIEDLFIMWDYKKNISYLIFSFNKVYT